MRNAVIGIVVALAVGVFTYLKNRPQSAEDADYKTVVKPAFSVNLPAWPVEVEQGTPGLGKYKVKSKSRRAAAEVSWQGGGAATAPEDMRAMADALAGGFGFDVESQKEDDSIAGQYRYQVVASLKGKVWMNMILINCEATNVLATLGFTAASKNDSDFMAKKALESFECKGSSPEGFAGVTLVSTSLDESFGQYVENDVLTLASAEGHLVLSFGGAESNLADARKYPEKTLQSFGQLLELSLAKASSIREQKGYDGSPQWLVTADIDDSEQQLVLGGFACPSISQAYLALALSDAVTADIATLDGIIGKLGCPSEGSDNLRNRKSACEVGAKEYCPETTSEP